MKTVVSFVRSVEVKGKAVRVAEVVPTTVDEADKLGDTKLTLWDAAETVKVGSVLEVGVGRLQTDTVEKDGNTVQYHTRYVTPIA